MIVGGQTVQFTAQGVFTDGPSDATSQVNWASSNPKVLYSLGAGKFVAAPLGGMCTITASAGAVNASVVVTVVQSTVVQNALARLPIQFADKPNMRALVACLVAPIQQLNDTLTSIKTSQNVYQAFGATLTALGNIVGQPRVTNVDADFQRYVAARIAANKSDGTPFALLTIAKLVLNDPTNQIILQNEGMLTARMRIVNAISSTTGNILASLVIPSAKAGVRLVLEWSTVAPSATFTFNTGPGFNVGALASSSG